ncbi:hypothetical protein [Actinomyces trachealis]|uniref:hypothetical protein n=1 Tax=Actinomyces trachealis TaxID=2763540 RepID=UPI0018C6B10A|nr:hypothetical protein [Actinomyces trachealis]
MAFRPFAAAPAQLTTLFTLFTVLGGALASGLLLSLGAASFKEAPSFSKLLPAAIGMTLSGRLNSTQEVFIAQVDVNLTFLALGTLGIIGAGVFLLTRRRRRIDGSLASLGTVAMRSGAEALAISLVSAILLGFLRSSIKDGDTHMELKGSFLGVFLMVLLLVFVAQFLGRVGDQMLSRVPVQAATPLREVGALFWSIGVVMVPVSLVGGAIAFISKDAAGGMAVLPVYLGNLVTALVALGSFGAVRADTSPLANMFGGGGGEDTSKAQFAWNLMGGWSVLLFVVMLALVALIAVRVGIRRPRLVAPDLTRTWQLPVLAWILALVFMHLLAPARVSVSALGHDLGVGASITWWSSMTFALLTALASVAAEYVPAFLYSISVPLLRLCAGSAATDGWLRGQTVTPAAAQVAGFPATPEVTTNC